MGGRKKRMTYDHAIIDEPQESDTPDAVKGTYVPRHGKPGIGLRNIFDVVPQIRTEIDAVSQCYSMNDVMTGRTVLPALIVKGKCPGEAKHLIII